MEIDIREVKDLIQGSCEMLPGHYYIAAVDSNRVSMESLEAMHKVLCSHNINVIVLYRRGPEAPLKIYEVTPEGDRGGE